MLVNGLESLKKMWEDTEAGEYPLYAILLYTSADKAFSDFVQEYWVDIHSLSGTSCLVFAFHPQKNGFGHVLSFDVPLEESYVVAREFGIDYQHLPGLLFFKDMHFNQFVFLSLRNITSGERFINNIRRLFNSIQAHPELDVIKKYSERRKLGLWIMKMKKPIYDILSTVIKCLQ